MKANVWNVDRVVLPDRVQAAVRITTDASHITGVDGETGNPGAEHLAGTLLPGFVDLQCNGAGGRSVDEATPEALDTVAKAVWQGGAVAFLPTLITAPFEQLLEQVAAVAQWIASASGGSGEAQAIPLGLHVEGPFLTAPGAHNPDCLIDPTPERVEALLAAAAGKLRLVTLSCARPGAAAAIEQFGNAGVGCAIGHCAEVTGFAECVAAGATSVTHLFNVMGSLHHRDANLAAAVLDEERVTAGIIVDGVHVQPAMVRHAFSILGPDRIVLVTDAVAAAGMPDGDYALSGMRVTKTDGVVRDSEGRLAGSALTMAQAARNFLEFVPKAGVWTMSRVASCNPARIAGARELGSVESGKRAVFTLLAEDGSMRCVAL